MELRGYLDALRVRWLLVVALAALGGVLGLAAYLVTPPVYASTVTFYVSVPPVGGGSSATATQYAQAKVNSYVSLVRTEEVARRVIADQRLNASPASVAGSISASAQLNTSLITATVRDGSADRSLAIARGLASTFGPLVDSLDNQGRPAGVIRIQVVSGPTLAASPLSPELTKFVGLGLLAGLVLGALLAVLRDLLDVTVRSPETAAEVVGAPTLAVVDEDPEPKGRAEAIHRLRTSLAFLRTSGDATRGGEVVVLTSALGGEGKTTTAVELARAMSELGERVLLIEADLRRPALRAALGLEAGPGLSEVLAGQADVDAATRPGGVGGLVALPAGSVPSDPVRLLSCPRMADLVAQLRTRYDKVLLDAPPLLPVTDAAICSTLADGVLLVVRWGSTRRQDVREAVVMLQQVHARVLGGVLNGRRLTRSERQHYGSYFTDPSPHPHSWARSILQGGRAG